MGLRRLVVLILVLCAFVVAAAAADFDCNQRINGLILGKCCKTPSYQLTTFKKQCEKYSMSFFSPCLIECLFNATNAWNGTDLDFVQIEKTFNIIMGGNTGFVDAYSDGLRYCSTKAAKPNLPEKTKENCSILPGFYALCAHKYVSVHCPSASWTNSTTCNQARDYQLYCKPENNTRGVRRRH